ncbi:ankyrin repeat domain-containing protein SOWAHA [Myxocyprinus asiaticus]|uniref:ankyrin repeat domain-containing protein SOWAHA n=1 Tax=Myxocyprinus asiaticus TaxID=70543 RepID=UPI002223266B|nr:ankyrin repeat domain-containing protein SOWAHA [Myxocyprinus asiaticus]
MALTQDIILTFLLEHGGKVKNLELVSKFKALINSSDPAEEKHNRDLFKRLVNNVAVVKQVDDVKYVVVKKKYQGFKGENVSLDNSLFELKSPCSRACSTLSIRDSNEIQNADIINNNYYHCTTQTMSECRISPSLKSDRSAKWDAEVIHPDYNAAESLTARVLSVTSDARSGKTGSVFALVAIKSPPNPQRELQLDERTKTNHKALEDSLEQQQLPLEMLPPPVMAEKTMKLKATACHGVARESFRTPRTKRKELDAPGSPQLRRCNKVTRPGNNESKDCDIIPLGSMEHEWLVKSATGCFRQIYGLLLQDPQLAEKRNFMSGFTILHWAAKSGNSEMVCKIIDVSRQSGAKIDVNAKSYDGYTPLHIAAIHRHECVLSLLVCEYGANANIRDNSGKKPYRYLSQDVSLDIRKMLGDPQVLQQSAHCYLGDDHSLSYLPKGFSTLSKLFQPHIAGHKKKYRRRQSFHFISNDHEDSRKNIALNRKLF